MERTEKITSYGYVVKSSSITVLVASIKMAFKLFDAKQKLLENEKKLELFKSLVGNAAEAISIKDNQNKLVSMTGIHTDISEKKILQNAMNEYSLLLDSIFKSVESMLIVINENHQVIVCNFKDHEWVPESIRKQKFFCYKQMKKRDEPCPHCPASKTFSDGKIRHYEEQNPVDSSYKYISVVPIFDEINRVKYVLENVLDITSFKNKEPQDPRPSHKRNTFEDSLF